MTSSTSDDKLSPQQIGRAFVIQYYRLLHECPNLLHRFYSNTSTFMHEVDNDEEKDTNGNGDIKGKKSVLNKNNHNNTNVNKSSSSSVVIGIDNIQQRIEELGFKNRHVKIRQVDCHSTILQSVVVQVCGEISSSSSNQGEQTKMKRFVQTFVLVPQSKTKYYVHNDIFRYQDPNQQDTTTIVSSTMPILAVTVPSINSTSLIPDDQGTYPADYHSLIPPGFDVPASSTNFLFSTAGTDSSTGTTSTTTVQKKEIEQPQSGSDSGKPTTTNNDEQLSYGNFSTNDANSWSQTPQYDNNYFFAKQPQQQPSDFPQSTNKEILTQPSSAQTRQFSTATTINEKSQPEQQEKTTESSSTLPVKKQPQQPKSYRDAIAVQPSSSSTVINQKPHQQIEQQQTISSNVKNNQSETPATAKPTAKASSNNTDNYNGSYRNNRMVNSYNDDSGYYPHGYTDDQEIFVGNLSFHATSDEVREYLSTYGQIISCRIGNTGSQPRSSNFAFVVCDTIDTAKRILDDKENLQQTKKINVEAKRRRPFPHTFRPSYGTIYSYNQNQQYAQFPMQGGYDEQYNNNGSGSGYYRNQNSRKGRGGRGGGGGGSGTGGNKNSTVQTAPSV
ncbi:unnamed protein product [Didymodactylos carnosus]|uniref:Uncharacterized protein n=1 Tax=Didymodactylos carnosus TaxID=1234261 RepID=A0A813W399_9BILA|nr:unnamed protein product [Didymodactylos carnosus]CAF0850197.1 unnamed protein product [Didymodactylos carnosus]CAF3576291.1 unnamed protein product [Didymodactylos carnosus]CAF3637832.1 unnamed protein product [Didymodactylos carnosus]